MAKVGIIGAGSFSMALCSLLGNQEHDIIVWSHDKELADHINKYHKNRDFLTDIDLPETIYSTVSLEEAVQDKDFLIMVIPTQFIRTVLTDVAKIIDDKTLILNGAKGIEIESLLTISEIFEEILPSHLHNNMAFMSGPSFALEIAQKQPTAVSVASKNPEVGKKFQEFLSTNYFRVYTSDDVMGIELCGALKNIIAIAAGILDGLGLGSNPLAALITRGLAEISRLGIKKGANPLTFLGLAGMGDLVLTCTGKLSRNRFVGNELGKGKTLDTILSEMTMVAEGVRTTKSTYHLAKKLNVEMPITNEIYEILYNKKSPVKAIQDLMTRDLKDEVDSTIYCYPLK